MLGDDWMESIRNVFITPKQFEEIQSKYDGVCEYLNGEILFSSRTSKLHNRVVRKILSKLDDYFIKARIYQKFGVLEYNIVEPSGSITQYSLVNGTYGTPNVFSNKDIYKSTVYTDLTIQLENVFKQIERPERPLQ